MTKTERGPSGPPFPVPGGQTWSHPPGPGDIEAIARAALAAMPPEFSRQVEGVLIRVDEFPDAETQSEMGLESQWDLLGLYRGAPIDRRSVADVRQDLDVIELYRAPILDYWCETGEDLNHVVRHVLIHEIGHHLGFSDAEMERIEALDSRD